MAETYIPKSPRPTRAQIDRVFGKDPDFARKVERIFEDLVNAAAAANANADQIDEIQDQADSLNSLVAALNVLVKKVSDQAESIEQATSMINTLNARLLQAEREISDLKEAP